MPNSEDKYTHPVHTDNLNDKDKVERWRTIVADFMTTGLSQEDYSLQHGLKKGQLSYYCRKFYSKKELKEKQAFVPLTINANSVTSNIIIKTPSGFSIELSSDFNHCTLTKVLTSLRQLGC